MSTHERFRTLRRRGTFAAILIFCATANMMGKRNDDVVVMKNGDHFTGEIKKLESGILYFKPAYVLNTDQVDWNRVDRLESKDTFTVLLTNGQRHTGTIIKTPAEKKDTADFQIDYGGTPLKVRSDQVSTIQPVEHGFWNQQTGYVNIGFSFNQGNSSTQFSIAGATDYRRERYWYHLDGSAEFSRQSASQTARYTTDFTYNRFITGLWYTGTIVNFLRSDQQDLAARTSISQGLGRILKRTNRTDISAIGGLTYTREKYFPVPGQQPGGNNVEAVTALNFSAYRFKTAQVISQTYVYPSLTTPGRVRISTNNTLMFELVRNLNWNFTLYENYDSHPPVYANKNDAGVSTGLGWTF